MKKQLSYALVFLIAACASREQIRHEQAAQKEVHALEEGLRVGMSLEEVKKLSPQITECRGSPQSFMRCHGAFMTRAGRFVPIQVQAENKSQRDTYTHYILHFEKNRLQRWDSTNEPWAR